MWLKPKDVMDMAWDMFRNTYMQNVCIDLQALNKELTKLMAAKWAAQAPLDAMCRPVTPISIRRCAMIANMFIDECLAIVNDLSSEECKQLKPTVDYDECSSKNVLKAEASLLYEMQSEYFSTVIKDRYSILIEIINYVDPKFQRVNLSKVSECVSFFKLFLNFTDGERNPTQVDFAEQCVDFNVLNDLEFDALCTLLEPIGQLGGLYFLSLNGQDLNIDTDDKKRLIDLSKIFDSVISLVSSTDMERIKEEKTVAIYGTEDEGSRILFRVTGYKDVASLECMLVLHREKQKAKTIGWTDIHEFPSLYESTLSKLANLAFDPKGIIIED